MVIRRRIISRTVMTDAYRVRLIRDEIESEATQDSFSASRIHEGPDL